MTQAVQGYAEGYYGRLPSWQERHQLLEALSRNGQNTYYYAPKEDARHRLHWREPYDAEWRQAFRAFCAAARKLGITVVAGVAPGLDFDFKDLDGGPDLQLLLDKCRQLLSDGADTLSLLMDDIDEDFHRRSGGMTSEGRAHALLANRLAEEFADELAANGTASGTTSGTTSGTASGTASGTRFEADTLGNKLWITPRIYANELAGSAPDYLPDFLSTLDESLVVLYCGSDIVARQADYQVIHRVAPGSAHSLVLWDNLYANDYCPQRLFVGPWAGREQSRHCLLNPTGMLHTDCLLLDLMAATRKAEERQTANRVPEPGPLDSRVPAAAKPDARTLETPVVGRSDGDNNGDLDVSGVALSNDKSFTAGQSSALARQVWKKVMTDHGVPDEFFTLAAYFDYPVFNGEAFAAPPAPDSETFAAIETCLWRWKTPLSREWYPFLFNLKLDLLIQQERMSALRIRKTQSAPMALHLGAGESS